MDRRGFTATQLSLCQTRTRLTLELLKNPMQNNITELKAALKSGAKICVADGANLRNIESACSQYDPNFSYTVGQTVEPTETFNEDRWNECSTGIHFLSQELKLKITKV